MNATDGERSYSAAASTAPVTITAHYGFGPDWNSVPHDIRQGIAMFATYRFVQREAASIGPDSGPVSDVPFSVKQIIEPYLRTTKRPACVGCASCGRSCSRSPPRSPRSRMSRGHDRICATRARTGPPATRERQPKLG
jgi:hypothetical protein